VRYRSATGGMLGMEMPDMSGGDEDGPPRQRGSRGAQQQPQSPADAAGQRRRAIMKGLGGALGLPN
jgi:hypothetical protein